MFDYIKNNLVSILGVLAAIIVPIILFFHQRNRKELSFEVLSSTSLVVSDDSLKNRLKIMIDDHEINGDIHLVLLKLINTGNVPIKVEDFDQVITIDSPESTYGIKIADLKEKKPNNLSVKIDNSSFGKITVDPLLLNPKDEFTLKLLIPGYKNDLTLESRIVGGQLIKFKKRLPLSIIFLSIALIMTPTLLIYFLVNNIWGESFAITLSGAIFTVLFLSVLNNLLTVLKRKLKED